MNRADILDLYRYDEWANERLAAAIAALPPELWARHWGGSHPSLRGAFSHIVASEWIWLERWCGSSPKEPPAWMEEATVETAVREMREVCARRRRFLEALVDADLERVVSFAFLSGRAGEHRLGDLLVHVANHSTYHRGQVASMLRQAGSAPPATDFIVYRAEHPAGA